MIDESILVFINDENLTSLFNHPNGKAYHKQVDFYHPPKPHDPFHNRYQILLSSKFPAQRQELICLFPNHRKAKSQILRASEYTLTASLNKDINEAIRDSLDETVVGGRIKIAIAYGKQLYICKDISGTVYVVWAKCVTRISVGNVANIIAKNVPLLFNLTGQLKVKSVFLLKDVIQHDYELELLPLCKGNPLVMYPKKPIFVCESRPIAPLPAPIKTMSERMALMLITQETKSTTSWLVHEENLFKEDSEGENLEPETLTLESVKAEEVNMEFKGDPSNEPDPFSE